MRVMQILRDTIYTTHKINAINLVWHTKNAIRYSIYELYKCHSIYNHFKNLGTHTQTQKDIKLYDIFR